ncbi:MAG: ABC transporter permease [Aquificaceae bacterium]
MEPSLFTKVLISYFLLLPVILISLKENLNAERDMVESSIRTTIQLLIAGYVLGSILSQHSVCVLIVTMIFMSLVASLVASERLGIGGSFIKSFLISFFSLNLSTLFVFFSLYFLGVIKHDFTETITLWGFILGNSLNNVNQSFERLRAEASSKREQIESMVALGAPLKVALSTCIRSAMSASMIPKYNMLKSAGLVHIPGISVGMIIAGISPLEAMLYQTIVMYMLLSVGFLTSFFVILLSYKYIFY